MKTGRRLGKIPIIVVLYGHFPGCLSPLEDERLRSVPACAFEPQPQDGAQEKFVSTSREGGNEFKIGAAGSTRFPLWHLASGSTSKKFSRQPKRRCSRAS